MRAVIGAVLALVAGTARAAEYHSVGKVGIGVIFVDARSIKSVDGKIAVWETLFLFKDGTLPGGTPSTAWIMSKDQFDCQADRWQNIASASYNSAGDSIGIVDVTGGWSPVVPDSNASVEERLACDPAFVAKDPSVTIGSVEMLGMIRKMGPGAFK